MNKDTRFFATAIFAAFLMGLVVASVVHGPRLSTANVTDRIVGRFAKLGLRLLFQEPPPPEEPERREPMQAMGSDGYRIIDHGASL